MVATDRTTKQLLLRVPEDLHARLAKQAAREGRSMNAVANDALQATLAPVAPTTKGGVDPGSAERERLRARLAELGMLADPPRMHDGPRLSEDELQALWDRVANDSLGLGPVLEPEIRADCERV